VDERPGGMICSRLYKMPTFACVLNIEWLQFWRKRRKTITPNLSTGTWRKRRKTDLKDRHRIL
jgi:hypothetical protein